MRTRPQGTLAVFLAALGKIHPFKGTSAADNRALLNFF
jgi:hypothetical protein